MVKGQDLTEKLNRSLNLKLNGHLQKSKEELDQLLEMFN
jgi:hypothetical protein